MQQTARLWFLSCRDDSSGVCSWRLAPRCHCAPHLLSGVGIPLAGDERREEFRSHLTHLPMTPFLMEESIFKTLGTPRWEAGCMASATIHSAGEHLRITDYMR